MHQSNLSLFLKTPLMDENQADDHQEKESGFFNKNSTEINFII